MAAPNVVIVEGDLRVARALEILMSQQGYRVSKTGSGNAAVAMVERQQPDLVLLDLLLPDVDGFATLKRLRENPLTTEVPVLALSSKPQPAHRARAARAGANAYVTMPYDAPTLLDLVRSLLTQRTKSYRESGLVTFLGHKQEEVISVAAYTGLALARRGHAVTIVDPQPYSTELEKLVDLPLPPEPLSMSERDAVRRHLTEPDGVPPRVRALGNLEGSGGEGALTHENWRRLIDALLPLEDTLLIATPLYPNQAWQTVVERSNLTLLLERGERGPYAYAPTTLARLQQMAIPKHRRGLILLGHPEEGFTRSNPALPTLAIIPTPLEPRAPSFDELAERLAAHLLLEGEREG